MDSTLKNLAKSLISKENSSFDELSKSIVNIHQQTQTSAIKAVNQMFTLRNWLIGCYIVEYEQNGNDRAVYGDKLLKKLEERVQTKGLNETLFRISRRFYLLYPQFNNLLFDYKKPETSGFSDDWQIHATPSHKFTTSAETLLTKLSFSHIREIMTQEDSLERYFYETECIKGTWS